MFYWMKNMYFAIATIYLVISGYFVLSNLILLNYLHYHLFDIGILLNNVGCLFSLVLFTFIVLKYHGFLRDLRDLSVMVYTGGFYSKENKSSFGENKKEMQVTYFPKMYIKYQGNMKVISIKIVSTRFQKMEEMDQLLEDRFSMEIIGKDKSKGYVTYYLDRSDVSTAIVLDTKMKLKPYEVPITDTLSWDIIKAPHGLITGVTDSGKSYLLMYLIATYIRMGCDVHVIDGKQSKLYHLESILGKEKVAFENAQILKQLRLAEEEMYRRQEAMKKDAVFFEKHQHETFVAFGLVPYILVIDEFLAIRLRLKPDEEKEYRRRLFQLILQGREVGVYVILSTQRADAEFLDGAIRDNLHFRVSLGNVSKDAYRMTFGDLKSNFKKRDAYGHGYLYIYAQSTVVRELYTPIIPKSYNFYEDVRRMVGGVRGATAEP